LAPTELSNTGGSSTGSPTLINTTPTASSIVTIPATYNLSVDGQVRFVVPVLSMHET